MERMNEYHSNRKHANSSSEPGLNINLATTSSNSGNAATSASAAAAREQDQYMPIANVIRIMRRVLPAHAKISDDAKETVQECVSEYISFVTAEANDRCRREQRKTVTAEDVLWAMAKLGFDDYLRPLTLFLNRLRANNNNASASDDHHHDHHHHHHHDHRDHHDVDLGGGSYGPGLGFGLAAQYQGVFEAYFRDGFGGGGGGGGGGGTSSSSSSSFQNGGVASYDPFGQFK